MQLRYHLVAVHPAVRPLPQANADKCSRTAVVIAWRRTVSRLDDGPSPTNWTTMTDQTTYNVSSPQDGAVDKPAVGRRVLIPRGWAGLWSGVVVREEGHELVVRVDMQPDLKRCERRHAHFLT